MANIALEVIAQWVDDIIAHDDPETQHANEDALRLSIIRSYAPAEVVAEVDRLAAADFPRWHA